MEKKSLNEWAAEVHENAVAHGWYEEEPSFGEVIANCHAELSEALEEYRNRRPLVYCEAIETNASCVPVCDGTDCLRHLPGRKPEGIAVEMIDCIIRILDWCANAGVDVDALLAAKHEYNKTRPYRHGNKAMQSRRPANEINEPTSVHVAVLWLYYRRNRLEMTDIQQRKHKRPAWLTPGGSAARRLLPF